MKRTLLYISIALVLFLVTNTSKGQMFVDSCFYSAAVGTSFTSSGDLASLDADLLQWDGTTWLGQWSNANVNLAPPTGSAACHAIWMGDANSWTTGGEGFGIRLINPLVTGQSYSITFTYASNGFSATGNFAPFVMSNTSASLAGSYQITQLPSAGFAWFTYTLNFTAVAAENGHNWIVIHNLTSGTSGIMLSFCSDCNTVTQPCSVNLGPDTTLCAGATYTLNAGNVGSAFTWSTGATTQTINVNTTGTYWAIANTGSCSDTDTVVVTFNPNVTVNLGNDTTLCNGSSLTLNAQNAGAAYLWSTGATTQSINVTTTGNYSVTVTSGVCSDVDTLTATFVAGPVANLGADISVCNGVPVTLDAQNAGANYLWSNGATTQTISPTVSGSYWVVINIGNCISKDTVNVTFNAVPVVNLGPDQSLCSGTSVILNAGNAGATYNWSDGSTTQTIAVNVAGTYWVLVQNGTCVGSDTVIISGNVAPTVNLGPDIKLCYGIDTALNAGNPGYNYFWNTAETTQRINIYSSGIYWVQVSNNGCVGTDTVIVYIGKKLSLYLGVDTFICPGEPLQITAEKGFASYSWTPSGSGSYFIIVDEPGTYICNAVDTNGCPVSSSILVQEFCATDLYIPNSFTPNGNRANDRFMAFGEGIVDYHLYIFNRWGELIFESTDISNGWDGKYDGTEVPQGSYIYRVDYKTYTLIELQAKSKYGIVNLLR